MIVAVAGATGRLGSRVVARLAAAGVEVRVLTREPARARHLAAVASDITVCDVRDRAATRSAVRGARTLVSAVHGFAGPGRVSPRSVDRDGNANLIDAAEAAGADVVLVSIVGAAADSPLELARAKHAAEEHLKASRTAWTIVRATAFVELWAEILERGIVFGRGENPINFVSVEDVAAAVERAVLRADQRGRVIDVAGPQDLTLNELATLAIEADGTHKTIRHVPRWLLRLLAPLSRQARAALVMDTADMTFAAGRSKPRSRPGATSTARCHSASGKAPPSVADYVTPPRPSNGGPADRSGTTTRPERASPCRFGRAAVRPSRGPVRRSRTLAP